MYIVQVHTSGGEGGHKDREPKTRMDRGRYVGQEVVRMYWGGGG